MKTCSVEAEFRTEVKTCNDNLTIRRLGRRSFQILIGSHSPYFVVIKNQKAFIEYYDRHTLEA